jgi:ribosomal protein S18 acetylase RimI-like enzyme
MGKLICSNGLNYEQLEDIKQLEAVCNTYDQIKMKLNWDFLSSRPEAKVQDFLYYSSTDLVGFLAIYIFNQKEVEISAMVHPEYRQRGIFNHLLRKASEYIKELNINNVLFFCDKNSRDGLAVLQQLNAKYEFSEYLMEYKKDVLINKSSNDNLLIRPAKREDLPYIVSIDIECFHMPENELQKIVSEQFQSKNILNFVAEYDNKIIGKINVLTDHVPCYIFGFSVLPSYQGKGFGSEILLKTLHMLEKQNIDQISLEVSVENLNALKLYENVGFYVSTGYDYFRKKI